MEKADRRLRSEEAMELALLGVTDTAASDFTSDICDDQAEYTYKALRKQWNSD